MRVALAQLDPVVGAFEANVRKILDAYRRAREAQARVVVTPELGVCGYPPHDLMDRPEMLERNDRALADLAAATRGEGCALVVGHVARNPAPSGRAALNQVSVLENGRVSHSQAKMLLPTYDVFDEARYFEPGPPATAWALDGNPVALAICEDLWARDPSQGRRLYGRDPIGAYRASGAGLVLSVSASPYEWGKRERREALHREVARELGAALLYVNQTGATDEILFDGGSFGIDCDGALAGRLPSFEPSFGVVDWDPARRTLKWVEPAGGLGEDPAEIETLRRALGTGIREYFARTGFKKAVLGLSGGIDSSVVAALAVEALGPKQVLGIAMPSQFSSPHSLEDAEALARNLGIGFEVRPIKFAFSILQRELAEGRGALAPIAVENLQARLRAVIMMTLANHYAALVLTTGNKSELATGYCTLYGDMAGALAPIGDLWKTRVYELARHLNRASGHPIPERCLTKAPSAELRPNQTDQDTLPPYEALDAVLEQYVEQGASVADLEKRFALASSREARVQSSREARVQSSREARVQSSREARKHARNPMWVREVLKLLEMTEYKRRQAAPVLKISRKAFGIGRRIPIAKIWDQ